MEICSHFGKKYTFQNVRLAEQVVPNIGNEIDNAKRQAKVFIPELNARTVLGHWLQQMHEMEMCCAAKVLRGVTPIRYVWDT